MDRLKLMIAIVPMAVAIGAFYYYPEQLLLVRVLGLLGGAGVSVFIALQTEAGAQSKLFLRNSIIEVRKVVWPTRKETLQTTLIVVVVVIIVALFLWFLDWLLGGAVRWLTN